MNAASSSTLFTQKTERVNIRFLSMNKKHAYINKGQLSLDASPWVCIAESFLVDQQDVMRLAIERTEHIRARVGYA